MFEEQMKITSEIIRQESNVKDRRERNAGDGNEEKEPETSTGLLCTSLHPSLPHPAWQDDERPILTTIPTSLQH